MAKNKGHKDIEIEKLRKKIAQLEAERGTGRIEKESEKFGRNSWDLLEDVLQPIVDVVKKSRKQEWSWVRNWNCKYISVRIDMRSGHCIIINDQKERISVRQLEFQKEWEKNA